MATRDYGIKISAEGYDVKTADSTQLVLNSKYNAWEVLASGVVAIPMAAGVASADATVLTTVTSMFTIRTYGFMDPGTGVVIRSVTGRSVANGYTALAVYPSFTNNGDGTFTTSVRIYIDRNSSAPTWGIPAIFHVRWYVLKS